jgi:hypothetical protein
MTEESFDEKSEIKELIENFFYGTKYVFDRAKECNKKIKRPYIKIYTILKMIPIEESEKIHDFLNELENLRSEMEEVVEVLEETPEYIREFKEEKKKRKYNDDGELIEEDEDDYSQKITDEEYGEARREPQRNLYSELDKKINEYFNFILLVISPWANGKIKEINKYKKINEYISKNIHKGFMKKRKML